MSNDLISRKSLIENLNKFAPECYNALINDLIAKEPTAFDKEKVISEMKKEYEDAIRLHNENIAPAHSFSALVRKDVWGRAVEIVEKGGIE